jgi:hypothetical protein
MEGQTQQQLEKDSVVTDDGITSKHNFFLDWLLFCSIWRSHEEVASNRRDNFICMEQEQLFQDCMEEQQHKLVVVVSNGEQHHQPSTEGSEDNSSTPTCSTVSDSPRCNNQESDGNVISDRQKLKAALDDPPQSILDEEDNIKQEYTRCQLDDHLRQSVEDEYKNKISLLQNQLKKCDADKFAFQEEKDLLKKQFEHREFALKRRLEDDYQNNVSLLQLQLENYEKESKCALQKEIKLRRKQCEEELLLQKNKMDAERKEYEKKVEFLQMQLTSTEEEKESKQLSTGECSVLHLEKIESGNVQSLQNQIRQMEEQYAEKQLILQRSIHAEYKEAISLLQFKLKEVETENKRTLLNEIKQIEEQFAERESKQKQIILETVSNEYQSEISSLRRQLVECETEKVKSIQSEKIQLEHRLVELESKLEETVAASSEYLSEISALRMELVHSARRHEVQIKSLQDKHETEMTDLIKKLDDFIEEQDESSFKKDDAIAALSSQVAEARAMVVKLENDRAILEHQKEALEKNIRLLQEDSLNHRMHYERNMENIRSNYEKAVEEGQNIRRELSEAIERYEYALKESKAKEQSYRNQLENALCELDKSQINCSAAQSSLVQLVSLKIDDFQKAAVHEELLVETTNKMEDTLASITATNVTLSKPVLLSDSSDLWLASYPVIEKQSSGCY